HSHHPFASPERQIERGRGWQRIGAEAGHLALLESPAGHRQLFLIDRVWCGPRWWLELATGIGQEDLDRGGKGIADLPACRLEEAIPPAGDRQLTAHGIQRGGPALALAGKGGLLTHANRQSADHEGYREHDAEGREEPQVRYRKGEGGRHEEEIEQHNAG